MRFSTQMMYQQNMRGITNSQAEWMKYGEQMSTGKRVVNSSDDPIAASQAVVLSQAQAQNSQYTLARTFATQKVSLEESVLSQRHHRYPECSGKNCLRQQWHLE
ncbi:flagellar hook-associated protein 3 [Escherichia coli]|uniref:Flagellar hook-associated protein 3 n=1 Tax=Escherichia coli TaxID=562 RepID=A0A376L6H5_ECOLX|nr:flagellar hook-associated protein 3 [Escherichia coli]